MLKIRARREQTGWPHLLFSLEGQGVLFSIHSQECPPRPWAPAALGSHPPQFPCEHQALSRAGFSVLGEIPCEMLPLGWVITQACQEGQRGLRCVCVSMFICMYVNDAHVTVHVCVYTWCACQCAHVCVCTCACICTLRVHVCVYVYTGIHECAYMRVCAHISACVCVPAYAWVCMSACMSVHP